MSAMAFALIYLLPLVVLMKVLDAWTQTMKVKKDAETHLQETKIKMSQQCLDAMLAQVGVDPSFKKDLPQKKAFAVEDIMSAAQKSPAIDEGTLRSLQRFFVAMSAMNGFAQPIHQPKKLGFFGLVRKAIRAAAIIIFTIIIVAAIAFLAYAIIPHLI